MTLWLRFIGASLGLTLSLASATSSVASEQSQLVVEAQKAFQDMQDDPTMTWFRNKLKVAQAILIAPEVLKAGFIVGGSGGRGVLLAKNPETGDWEGPAFYTLASGSIGLQAGASVSQTIMLVMTQKGMDSFLSSNFKLGGDASVAAGPVGAGAKSNIVADVFTFTRSQGLYAGLNFDGTAVTVNDKWNQTYYGQAASPVDILVRHAVSNPEADVLKRTVAQAAE